MSLRTLKQLKDVKGKRVLLRVDFNVPIHKGNVADDTRIRETLPTIKLLLKKRAKVIIITHLGRPEGKAVASLRLDPVAKHLSKLLDKKVSKQDDCVGPRVEAAIGNMKDGDVMLLENVRFHEEEERCEPKFVKALAKLGDIFVNDAFATCHRKHASTAGIAAHLPAFAGLLVENELAHLTPLLNQAEKPLVLLVGGAKVDTKIGLLKSFFGKADHILIGGALANTFLAAEGYDIGASLFEPAKIEVARELLMLAEKQKQSFLLPEDVIVADVITEHARTFDLPLEDVEGEMKILDIGKRTLAKYAECINQAKTVIWNGPMGLFEFTPFSKGTFTLAKTLATHKGKTYLGGGDTIDALKRCNVSPKKFTFVSTGGGAMLEFLEGKNLPGIEVLQTR